MQRNVGPLCHRVYATAAIGVGGHVGLPHCHFVNSFGWTLLPAHACYSAAAPHILCSGCALMEVAGAEEEELGREGLVLSPTEMVITKFCTVEIPSNTSMMMNEEVRS